MPFDGLGFVKPGREIFRDFVTHGVPASGAHPIAKADMRAWMAAVETAVEARPSILNWIPEDLHDDILAGISTEDLTEYFQAVIDHLEEFASSSARPALYVPAGLYHVGALTADKNIELVGDGRRCTFIRQVSGETDPMWTLAAENVAGTSLTTWRTTPSAA